MISNPSKHRPNNGIMPEDFEEFNSISPATKETPAPHGHEPVLASEILDLLNPSPGNTFADCTTGRAGHSLLLAGRLAPDGTLLCIDADARNLEFARERLRQAPCRVRFFHANFSELPDVLAAAGVPALDGFLADLGVSTNQLFENEYGMSFRQSMPLDMRIDLRTEKSAADLVNVLPEEDLANVLYELAQERYSRRIARKIGQARAIQPITTTDRLAELVRSAIPIRGGAPLRIDPATRTFLALRMAVNQERENLAALLKAGPSLLRAGGRAAVISFQSTEDRMVKQAFRSAEQTGQMKVLTKKPVTPSLLESDRNPRSRSAKLRVAEKIV
jgi:16S rRNA (cytosine1402-N4)-methyltransferase